MPNFWDLPKNVRDVIYKHHLVYDKPVNIDMHRAAVGHHGQFHHRERFMPPIFHLSKQVEREAIPFYYGMNVFDIGEMQLWSMTSITWPRHWNQVRRVECTWDRLDAWGGYGSVREAFISLSKMKRLQELNIRIDEAKIVKRIRVTRETRQRPQHVMDLTNQQNLAILRFPGITGLLTLSRINHVTFSKLIDPNGVESGGMIPGGALETHVLPRLKPKQELKRRKKGSSFRFLDLPPELRNHIYHLLLRVTGSINPSKEPPTSTPRDPESIKLTEGKHTKSALAILSVCKQMNEEAVGVYYSCNSFVFHYPVQLSAFLIAIGSQRKKMIRDITIYYHNLRMGGVELIDLAFPLLKQLPGLKRLHVLMIASLGETNLRRGWLKGYHHRWRAGRPGMDTIGTNPALIPGMRTLFELRGLTDLSVRDLELEKLITELEKEKAYPNFPKGSLDANLLKLSRAFEHFNAALADAQLGEVNEGLFRDDDWQTWDVFPTMDGGGLKTLVEKA